MTPADDLEPGNKALDTRHTRPQISRQRQRVSGSLSPGAPQYCPHYVLMATCNQPPGRGSAKSLVKRSLAELYPMGMTGAGTLTDGAAWANPGWVTSSATAGGALELPLASYAPDLSASTEIVAMVIRGPTPGTTTNLFGNFNGAYGYQGYTLQGVAGTGQLFGIILSSAGVYFLPVSNGVFLDGTEHTLLFAIHSSGFCALYRDGELDRVWQPNAATPMGGTTAGAGFALGGAASVDGIPPQPSLACQFKGVHILSIPASEGYPLNLGELAKKHFEAPLVPWLTSDLVMPSTTVGLFWAAGQSNESGAGNTAGTSGGYGTPVFDQPAARSVLSGVNAALAEQGVAALWARTAAGGTGLADTWCGRVRTWSNPQVVASGSYMISGGVIYRCDNPAGYVGASTLAPAVGTGLDGVTWVSLGTPTVEDTTTLAGTGIYPSTSARWDPMGLLLAATNAVSPFQGTTDATIGMISIGQTDASCSVPLAAFSDAMEKVALYWLAQGASKILLCNTVRTAIPAIDIWYDSDLIPGRAAALAALASNPQVYAGHDWATAVGPVTIQSNPINKGVKVDQVHMTDAAYELFAVPETVRALNAAGV